MTASKRSSAKELLDDPFLSLDDDIVISPKPGSTSDKKSSTQLNGHEQAQKEEEDELDTDKDVVEKTEMTITGKLNPDDDTIFLKVQIADKHGTFLKFVCYKFTSCI